MSIRRFVIPVVSVIAIALGCAPMADAAPASTMLCAGWGGCVAQAQTNDTSTTTPIGYGAGDLAKAYHLPAATVGATGTVAVLTTGDDPDIASDMAVYRQQYGLPACTAGSGCIRVMDQHGGPPVPAGPADEDQVAGLTTAVSVETASAACPLCRIVVVEVPSDDILLSNEDQAISDFADAANTAVAAGASSVVINFEYDVTPADITGDIAAAFDHPGVAFVAPLVAGLNTDDTASWPQVLPTVVNVSPTELLPQGNGFTNVADDASGSMCVQQTGPAPGQPASISALCGGHHVGADISAVGALSTAVATYDTFFPLSPGGGGWLPTGNITQSSFIAGLYTRGSHPSEVDGPNTLYQAPAGAFTDVTVGQNEPAHACQEAFSLPNVLCAAGKGWDGPSGVGVPDGLAGF